MRLGEGSEAAPRAPPRGPPASWPLGAVSPTPLSHPSLLGLPQLALVCVPHRSQAYSAPPSTAEQRSGGKAVRWGAAWPCRGSPKCSRSQGVTARAQLTAKGVGFYTQGDRGQQRVSSRGVAVLNREQAGGEDGERGPATCCPGGWASRATSRCCMST